MLPRANQSTGCYRCRKMKVKCDEQKPECQRCTKVKRKCPGYRPESGKLRFRSMNTWAASKVTDSDISQSQNAEKIALAAIRPSTPWKQVATTRFVKNFTIPTTRGWTGYLEYLPELLVSPSEPLHEALLAVSLAHFGNISCMPTLTKESEIHHDKALRALSAALGDPRAPAQDETLATVILLQKFEIISGTGQLSHSPHDEGAAAIIRQRQASPPASHIGKVLMQSVVMKQSIQAVCNGSSANLESGYVIIQNTVLGSLLWPLLRDVSICRSKIETAIAQVTFTPTQYSALKVALQEAMPTFNRLHHWPQNVPTQLRYKIAQSGEDGQLDFSTQKPSERTFVFLCIQHGALWMLYWLSCIHIAQAMKNGYNVMNRYLPSNNESKHLMDIFYERLLESATNIISCAPFLMGDVDEQGNLKIGETGKALGAFFLLRGLVTAMSVAEIPPSQKQTILAYLERIGSAFGIKRALVARNRH